MSMADTKQISQIQKVLLKDVLISRRKNSYAADTQKASALIFIPFNINGFFLYFPKNVFKSSLL